MRVDASRVVLGVLATDAEGATQRVRHNARIHPHLRVTGRQLNSALQQVALLGPGVIDDFAAARDHVKRRMEESKEVQAAVARELVNETETIVLQSHDFMQLVKLVKGHAEVLLADRYPELSAALAAEKLPHEGAIYFATDLMLAKMNALTYIKEANQAVGGESRFQIHPMILKYVRIYHWKATDKDLDIRLVGECRKNCRYNTMAIGAVVQGILDNLVKYAPASTAPTITFEATDERVTITFQGLGPKIEQEERSKIFLPQYRGAAARGFSSDGLGIGLAAAKSVSDALGLNIRVEQSAIEDPRQSGFYDTRFSIDLDTI